MKAIEAHKAWLNVWALVECLDGEIRYSHSEDGPLTRRSESLAKVVKQAVLKSQEELNSELLNGGEDAGP